MENTKGIIISLVLIFAISVSFFGVYTQLRSRFFRRKRAGSGQSLSYKEYMDRVYGGVSDPVKQRTLAKTKTDYYKSRAHKIYHD